MHVQNAKFTLRKTSPLKLYFTRYTLDITVMFLNLWILYKKRLQVQIGTPSANSTRLFHVDTVKYFMLRYHYISIIITASDRMILSTIY